MVKAALIIGAAIVASTALWIYFSPYHTCIRAFDKAEMACAAAAAGARP